jgi:hypothetical protein
MQAQINQLSKEVTTLVTTQKLNHTENRRDIGDLRLGQQQQAASINVGFEKVADSIERALTPIKQDISSVKTDIFNLQMWKSKTTGYVLGMSALGAFVFELVRIAISHGVKQ